MPLVPGGGPPPAGGSACRLLMYCPLNLRHEPILAGQAPQGACSCLHNVSACLLSPARAVTAPIMLRWNRATRIEHTVTK